VVLSALRESEERFRTMFEHSHDLLVVADENGNTIWGNPAWEKTLGYSIESSGAAFEKLHPDDRARVAQVFEAME
jgi:PAS domain S-box-containing protein